MTCQAYASTAAKLLRQHWQHEHFRPLQQEAVCTTLDGKDLLLILPTGAQLVVLYLS